MKSVKNENINTLTANEINTLILMAGCTGLEFARVLGVTEMTVNRWEQGQVKPSPEATARLIELRELLMGMDEDGQAEHAAAVIEGRVVEWLKRMMNAE
ncbi:MAG: helix-turn-helix domain-containing protein [Bryobacteraceae bacterium]